MTTSSINLKNFRVVVLDCPYNTWQSSTTQELFSAVVEMKLKGYQPVYEHGVMPIDSYDFVATHLLVCVEQKSGFKPVTGFKSVTLSTCRHFNLPFPTNAVLGQGNADHTEAVKAIIENCERNGKDLSFDSSWTVDPDFRRNRESNLLLQELFISNVVHWHTPEQRHEVLGTGILRVRTNRFFERIGFEQTKLNGTPLPSFNQPSLRDSQAVLIHSKEWSPFAMATAAEHQQAWNNRIMIQ